MLAGNLTDFSIEDIFQLFALTKKSGALRLATDGDEGRVYFAEGDVYFAVTDVRRLALGARLVGAGYLTGDALREIASSGAESDPVDLVRALLESGAVDPATIHTYLREQVVDAVSALMRLHDAAFTFDNRVPGAVWRGPRLSTSELLEEGRRRLREWEQVTAHVPDLDRALVQVPALPEDVTDVTLTRDQWQLLSLVDGRRSTTDLVDLTGVGEYATGKLVAGLVAAGLVELRPMTGRTAMEELLAGRESLRRLERVALAGGVRDQAAEAGTAPSPGSVPGAPSEERVDDTASGSTQALAPSVDAAEVAPAEHPSPAAEETSTDEVAEEQDRRDDEDHTPPAVRPPVDRAQMARELASLGFGDPGARRGVNRASAEPSGDAPGEQRPADQARQRETQVEHGLGRTASRGRFLGLIDGLAGA